MVYFVAEGVAHGSIRLVGGSNDRTGRVKVFIEPNNSWSTVCINGWDDLDAMVVCRQLGLNDTVKARAIHILKSRDFAIPLIWLDHVNCIGNESKLSKCQHNVSSNCYNKREDAGVSCDITSGEQYA